MSEFASDGQRTEPLWDKLLEAQSLASGYRMVWDKCLAYVYGLQIPGRAGNSDGYTGNIATGNTNSGKRKRLTIVNQIINIRRHVVSRLATDYPAMAALPASDTADDISKSTASEEALRYFWQVDNMRVKLRKTVQTLCDTGTVGLRTRFDTVKQNVTVDVVKPYDLFFEPYVTEPDESEWIAVRQYSTLNDIIKAYPDYEEELRSYAKPAVSYYAAGPQSVPKDRYELYDVYYRDGTHEVWACNKMLFSTITPNKRLPVQVIRYTEIDGYLWGLGLVEPLIPIQDTYNDARSQIRANTRLVGNPKISIPEEGDIDPKAFTDQPGEKVKFKNGAAPGYLAVPPLPQNLTEEPARALSEMFDVSGMHGTSLGKRTAGVSSGVAIQSTTQNDAQQLQLTQDAVEDAVREVAVDVLCYMRENYKESKMVRMLDSSGKLVWSNLEATRLTEDPEIFLQAGSLFRSEVQDRENRVYQMLEAGLMDPEVAKKHLALRTEPAGLLKQLQGLRTAQEVLEAIKKLGPAAQLKVYPTDDLDALEKVFGEFMRTPELYLLPIPTQNALDAAYMSILQMLNPIQAPPAGMPNAGAQQPPGGTQMASPDLGPPAPGLGAINAEASAMEVEA